jgi:acetyl esterase/lipase
MSEIAALRAMIAARPKPADLAEMRANSDARAKQFPVPGDATVEPITVNGVKAEWTSTPGADASKAILYLHGGGYVLGSLDSHRHVAVEIGRVSGTRTLALDYRLAPEHPFPAPVEDTVAAYRYLLDSGIAPRNICIAGDSAGGGLAVGAMLAFKEAGLPLPGCAWALSPWVDMEALAPSYADRAATDPTVQREGILWMARTYMGDADPKHPHAAPIHGDLTGLPPMLIQVGSVETLLDDSLMLARRAAIAGIPVELQIWPEMIHVWHLFFPILSDGRKSLASGGAFVRKALNRE